MSAARLVAIGFIYCCTAMAWFTLGGSVVQRTGESDQQLARQVAQLWGGQHTQLAPEAWYERPKTVVEDIQEKDDQGRVVARRVSKIVPERIPLPFSSGRLQVELSLDQRRKGLLWYDTYAVKFEGAYRLRNPETAERPVFVHLTFPATEAIYDGFVFRLNGHEGAPAQDLSKGVTAEALLPPGGEATLELSYRSRGLGDWTYAFAPSGVVQVHDFSLDMKTDFAAIDFPAGTLSPTTKAMDGEGWRLGWRFDSLVTGQRIGMDLPQRLNPGPLTARITFFAPVSLLFFVTVLVMLGVVTGRSLHPMNYFFLAAAFFAFHLLLAYLVDHVELNAAFAIASAASVALVVSYLRVVAGPRFAFVHAGLAQVLFLVLFSYAFFFEGFTGLAVAVGAVITLFVLMQVTARVDWSAAFAPNRGGGTP